MRAVVFVGPSLSVQVASRILDAIYMPPAKQADVVSAVYRFQPDVIGIIDGALYPDLAVWHKEILFALENGVAVYGAAGVGAVRAIETGAAGMIGVGRIFEDLQQRGIFGDDEVTCQFERRDGGYVRLSEPLVNLRATFEAARDNGLINTETCERLAAAAKTVRFQDRHLDVILSRAIEQGVPPSSLDRLKGYCRDHYVDLQKQDAVSLLEILKSLPAPGSAKNQSTVDHMDATVLHTLKYRDRSVWHRNVEIPLYALADYVAVHHPATDRLMAHAKNRYLAQCLADWMGAEVSDDEVTWEAQSFRAQQGLGGETDFQKWVAENDLSVEEFDELMRQNARIRKLQKWALTRLSRRRLTKIVLDELRLNNEYQEWAEQAAEAEHAYSEDQEAFLEAFHGLDIERLIEDHLGDRSWPWHKRFFEIVRDTGMTRKDFLAVLVKSKMMKGRLSAEKRQEGKDR